jgi:hypothetical protein
MEHPEAKRLLESRLTLDLNVRARPEGVEVLALQADEIVPAGVHRLRHRR